MSDYDDDYDYDDYDDYNDYDDYCAYDDGYADEGYDYGDYDHNEYDHHGAHDHDDHDAGGYAVAEELTAGFAVIEEVKDHHDQGSAFDGSGHEQHTGYAELVHSDDGYQTDDDQVPYYGVVSGGPSYVQGHDNYSTSRSLSQYTPSAHRGSAGYPPFAANGRMVDPQSHGGSYSQHPSSRSSGYQYNGNHHGPGRWKHGEHYQQHHSAEYHDSVTKPAYSLETQPSHQTHCSPSATSHRDGHGGRYRSDYEYLQAWGGRHNFMASYGLKPEPSGYEESRTIMNALRDREAQGYGSNYHSTLAAAHSPRVHPAEARNEATYYYPGNQGWW
ncbi:hypothetical protein B0T13DRAFT_284328 [Neurospora crassa]|nr:hypothetical protein B0T13DRAFT_284328 [Neurospora crassa]